MENNSGLVEEQLMRYAILFFLLGVIETAIRARVVVTLSDLADSQGKKSWIDVIPNEPDRVQIIKKARKLNSGTDDTIEIFLPFSFWKNLFKGRYFTSLWSLALYRVFPGLTDPLSKRSFDQVCTKMHRASKIRNRVAHFSFKEAGRFEEERMVLIWIIQKLGLTSRV